MSPVQATSRPRLRAHAALLAAGLLLGPLPLAAQAPELARIDSLVASTRLTEAGTALRRWQETHGRSADAEDAAHALLLRGRLHLRADSASAAYLEVALGYPSTRAAPEALLRLGQAALAAGDAERAAGHLERLVRDYPAAAQRTAAHLWLARAQRARGRNADACTLLAAAARDAEAGELRTLIDAELAACNTTGTHAVQVAAFRDAKNARALAERLRTRGFNARVVFIPGTSLALVRVGTFADSAAAAATLRRVRELHRDAAIVGDVARERTAP